MPDAIKETLHELLILPDQVRPLLRRSRDSSLTLLSAGLLQPRSSHPRASPPSSRRRPPFRQPRPSPPQPRLYHSWISPFPLSLLLLPPRPQLGHAHTWRKPDARVPLPFRFSLAVPATRPSNPQPELRRLQVLGRRERVQAGRSQRWRFALSAWHPRSRSQPDADLSSSGSAELGDAPLAAQHAEALCPSLRRILPRLLPSSSRRLRSAAALGEQSEDPSYAVGG